MRVVIVGGVAGGMSAATRLRRLNEDMEIIIIEKNSYVSYANCGLPYYVGGEIKSRDSLFLQSPESLKARFNLDVRIQSEATAINTRAKNIIVKGPDGTYELSYDKLILAPGGRARVIGVKGLEDADNVFTVRNVSDVDKIKNFIDDNEVKKAVVVGSGFIGLEMVENLSNLGLDVVVVEKSEIIFPSMDKEMGIGIKKALEDNGVKVYLGTGARAYENMGRKILLENGETIDTDLIIMSTGIVPNVEIAVEAGIKTGIGGGILVDDNYQTNIEDIYAVGDAIVVKNQISHDDTMIALASPANRQGRQVADVISGISRENKGSIGTSIVRVFDTVAGSTGLNERYLLDNEYDYEVVHVKPESHASYYPGSSPVLLKLLFNPLTEEIYGAQAIGADGIDKRIDVLATAIKGGLRVSDLPELELSYSPPFGAAKDPVNILGYAALNIVEGISENIQWYELDEYLEDGWKILDIRKPDELAKAGKLDNSVDIPLDMLRDRINELDKNQGYIIVCQSGVRGYIAERILRQKDFTVKNLDGAFELYTGVFPHTVTRA